MSGSEKKQSSGCSGDDGGEGGSSIGGNDQGKEIDGPVERTSPEEENRQKRGKGVFFLSFNAAKRSLLLLLGRRRKKRKKATLVNSRASGGCRGGGGDGLCCCFCFKQPMTLDSSIESPTSDPNSKEFTYDMMRVLIEKNDFYTKECNPHLDDKHRQRLSSIYEKGEQGSE